MSNFDGEKKQLLKEVVVLKEKLNTKQKKELKLDLLERLINIVFLYSEECEVCKHFLGKIENMIKILGNILDKEDNIGFKEYHLSLKTILSHLQKKHKLVTEGYYMSLYMSIGIAIGASLGI